MYIWCGRFSGSEETILHHIIAPAASADFSAASKQAQ